MADSKEINIYYKESVASMLDISDYLTTAFYRLDKNNDFVAFNMNPDTGYFQLKLAESLIDKEQTPQNTSDALAQCMKEMERTDADLQTLLTSNNKANIKLFNSKYLKLRKAPVSISRDGKVEKWELTFGVELDIYSSLGYGEVSETTGLEDDAVVIQVSGSFISEITYNHLPIIKKEAVIVFPEVEGCPIVYKNLKSLSLVAPFFFTSDGLYRPACKKSIVLQTSYSRGANISRRDFLPSNSEPETFYSLTKYNMDQDIYSRKCDIELKRTYKMVTIGIGSVGRRTMTTFNLFSPDSHRDLFSPDLFQKTFEKGNQAVVFRNRDKVPYIKIPQKTYYINQLNQNMTDINPGEFRIIEKEKINALDSDKLLFFNYSFKYDFNLVIDEKDSLIEILKWAVESKPTRGVIVVPFFIDQADQFIENTKKLNESREEEKQAIQSENYKIIQIINQKIFYEVAKYFLNKEKHQNKKIYLPLFDKLPINDELKFFLSEINCELYTYAELEKDEEYIELNIYEIFKAYKYVSSISNIGRLKFNVKKEAIGCAKAGLEEGEIPVIVLNDDYFNATSKRNINFSPTSVLVHEAGHNLYSKSNHTSEQKGDYEYNQLGLQSNDSEKCYPSLINTQNIVMDPKNIAFMTMKN